MAHVRKIYPTYLQVAYRDASGKQRHWRCADQATFERFDALEKIHKRNGTPVPDPAEMLGEVPAPVTSKGRRDARAASRGDHEIAEDDMPGAKRKKSRSLADVRPAVPSAAAWIGDPRGGNPGPYFEHAATMSDEQRRHYQSVLDRFGAHWKDKPMDQVAFADARRTLYEMLVCPNCLARAKKAKRTDLVGAAHEYLRVDKDPFDAPPGDVASTCVDEDGEWNHFALKRETVQAYLWTFRTLWRVAKSAAAMGNAPEFANLPSPFEHLSVPQFEERVTNDDLSEALTSTHIDSISRGMPEWLAALPFTGAHGLMRPAEYLGLERGMIQWPTLAEHEGQARIIVTHTYGMFTGRPRRKRWGKNRHSTREPILLSRFATERLRAHMEQFRSTPNQERCQACRDGVGEHFEAKTNPHRGCDFANDAPVWVEPLSGRRVNLRDLSQTWFPAACQAAGLTVERLGFRPTPKLLRATGATVLLDAGVPIETVARVGRWRDVEVLRQHYYRMREASVVEAARRLDAMTRGELGLDGAEEADLDTRVRFLIRRVEVLEEQLTGRDDLLAELGVDVDRIDRVDPADVRRRADTVLNDEARLRELAGRCANRTEMLNELGLAGGYGRLVEAARRFGIELPMPWRRAAGQTAPGEAFEDVARIRQLAAVLETKHAIARTLCGFASEHYVRKLEAVCADHGIALPEGPTRNRVDYSPLDDRKRLEDLIGSGASRRAVLVALGLPASDTSYRKLEDAARRLGLTLPDKVAGRPAKPRTPQAPRVPKPGPFDDVERIRELAEVCTSRAEILRSLGVTPSGKDQGALQAVAEREAIELPSIRRRSA
jgi:integrase